MISFCLISDEEGERAGGMALVGAEREVADRCNTTSSELYCKALDNRFTITRCNKRGDDWINRGVPSSTVT